MITQLTSDAGSAPQEDLGAAINRLVQQPPPNAWIIFAFGVFCLLVGTVVVTNTGERFSLDR